MDDAPLQITVHETNCSYQEQLRSGEASSKNSTGKSEVLRIPTETKH